MVDKSSKINIDLYQGHFVGQNDKYNFIIQLFLSFKRTKYVAEVYVITFVIISTVCSVTIQIIELVIHCIADAMKAV